MSKAHGAYKPGEIVELPDKQAASLIEWGCAAEVHEDMQQELIETASFQPDAESADATPRRLRN